MLKGIIIMSYIYSVKNRERDLASLRKELSRRYGDVAADEIIASIARGESGQTAPHCLITKACGDMLDVFRRDARTLLRQLKAERKKIAPENEKVSDLGVRRLEQEFRHIYRVYWISMKLFYPAYHRAMDSYRGKIERYGIDSSEPRSLSMAA